MSRRPYDTPAYRARRRQIQQTATTCHWCGQSFTEDNPVTADHDPPLSVAGPHLNLVPACRRCNTGRRHSTPHQAHQPSRTW